MPGGITSYSIPVALVAGATQQVATGAGLYCGMVIRETSAAALVLRVWDGTSATGTLLDVISLAANGRMESFTSIHPVAYRIGVFIERVSGTNYEGAVRLS